MRNFLKHGIAIAIPLTIAAVLTLTGCSTQSVASASVDVAHAPDGILILAGASANQPQAQLPVEVQPIIEAAVEARAPITVITVDGTPAVSFRAAEYEINTKNPVAEQNDVNKVQNALLAAVRGATADSNGSNLSAALSIAGDQAKADGSQRAAIIVVDSGLSDSGYPDLTTPGITETNPVDVVNFAAEHAEIPAIPIGATIYLTGIGYGAGPQVQLTPEQRNTVTAIWKGLLNKAGAAVRVIPTPRTGPPAKTSFKAGIVQPATQAQFTVEQKGNTLEANLGSDVLFQPDKWDLLPSATSSLNQLVDLLKQNKGNVTVQGFTDTGTTSVPGGLLALSQFRADAVKQYLVTHGIAPSRITATGEGTGGVDKESPSNRHVTVIVERASQP